MNVIPAAALAQASWNMTKHAKLRIDTRLSHLPASSWVSRAEGLAEVAQGSLAVRLGRVTFQGEPWSDISNGDDVVAIIRDRQVQTYMFRRATQPFTPEALRVQKTYDALRI